MRLFVTLDTIPNALLLHAMTPQVNAYTLPAELLGWDRDASINLIHPDTIRALDTKGLRRKLA
jgi:hypothetical protein